MDFKYFKPEELLGKKVLFKGTLRTITKVTKTGFRIESHEGLFDFTGYLKGSGGNVWSTRKFCYLKSPEEIAAIIEKCRIEKESKEMIAAITEKLPNLNYTQLTEIIKLIKPTV